MSREKTTFVVLLVLGLTVSTIDALQMGTPKISQLRDAWPLLAMTSIVFLVIGFFFGAVSAGIAALWASARKQQANGAAAFNLGFGAFVALQALGVVAYDHYTREMRPEQAVTAPAQASPQAKETD